MSNVIVHEGSHIVVVKGDGLQVGEVVCVEMEVVRIRDDTLVLHPRGKIGKQGIKANLTKA